MMTPRYHDNHILQSLSSAASKAKKVIYAQCVFSVCGPGVRVMLPGLTADQSVHCSSADQLGPGCVCWSLDVSAGAAACLQHHGERQQKQQHPNMRAWVGHLRCILHTDLASLTLYLNFFMTPRLVRLMSTQTDPASPQPSETITRAKTSHIY